MIVTPSMENFCFLRDVVKFYGFASQWYRASGTEEDSSRRSEMARLVVVDLLQDAWWAAPVVQQFRTVHPAAAVIVLQAFPRQAEVEELLRFGANWVLPKPVQLPQLAQILENIEDAAHRQCDGAGTDLPPPSK